ncbi:MAG: hypothetical protein AB7R77_23635 [Ilumatobacteraceae bacterium]
MGRTVRDGGRSGDQIEFLEPRDLAFGGDAPAEFAGFDIDDPPEPDGDEPRSKWLAGTAGVVVVALVAVGVIAAAPWDGSGGQAAPTTTASPTTTPTSTTTAPSTTIVADPAERAGIPGYVFDPLPDGFAIRGAWDAYGSSQDVTPRGWAEVWASPGATRTSGRWFSLHTGFDSPRDYATVGTRVDVGGGRIGILQERSDGVLSLSQSVETADDTRDLTIESFGLSTTELISLAATTVVNPRVEPDAPQVGFMDRTVLDGLERVVAAPSDINLLWEFLGPTFGTTTSYSSGSADEQIEVYVAASDSSINRRPELTRLALAPAVFEGPLTIPNGLSGSSELTLGTVTQWTDEPLSFARWLVDDLTITAITTLPMDELVDLIGTLRPATDREWRVAQRRAESSRPPEADDPGPPTGSPVEIASGSTASGDRWRANFTRPEWLTVTSLFSASGAPARAVDRVLITTFQHVTVLIAALAPDSPVTSMRVSVAGAVVGEAPIIPLTDLDATIEYQAKVGAVGFEQPGVFAVELLDAAGAVVDVVTSPGFEG